MDQQIIKTNEIATIATIANQVNQDLTNRFNIKNWFTFQINQITDPADESIMISGLLSFTPELHEAIQEDSDSAIEDLAADRLTGFAIDLVKTFLPEDKTFGKPERHQFTGMELIQYPNSGHRIMIHYSDYGLYFNYCVTLG